MIPAVILLISLVLSAQCEDIHKDDVTPAPPVTGDLGGTKSERLALFERYLNAGKPEQITAYRDDNPILREVLIAFNKTVQTQINGYAVHKAMLISNDTECDRKAVEKADATMQKAFDDTTECLIQFRHRVRSIVPSEITNIRDVSSLIPSEVDIRDVPQKDRETLILPIDECFEKMKVDTFKLFGENTAEHLICSKKIKN